MKEKACSLVPPDHISTIRSLQQMHFFFALARRGLTLELTVLLLVLASLVSPTGAVAGQLSLTWSDPTPDDHDGFKIMRRAGNDNTYGQVATVGATPYAYTDPNLTAGSTYCYEVLAYNAAGDSDPTKEACGTVATPLTYQLGISVTGKGTVKAPGGLTCTSSCSVSINAGGTVTLTETPEKGFSFSGWGGDCAGTGTTCSLTLDGNKNVSATFKHGSNKK